MVTPGIQVIGPFPPEIQRRIRRRAIRDCHKWDPQVGDTCTVGAFAVSLSQAAWAEIRQLVEQLAAETLAAEREIQRRPELFPRLGIPRALRPLLHRPVDTPDPPACRLMRFDVHPTAEGWRISEVNSDVPGGFNEAAGFPRLVQEIHPHLQSCGDPAAAIAASLRASISDPGHPVALVHATAYSDDWQVMICLQEALAAVGLEGVPLAPDALRLSGGQLCGCIDGQWQPLSAATRFYPGEWFPGLRPEAAWHFWFRGAPVPLCNPGQALLTQSKRFPLVWAELDTPLPAWKRSLPATFDPRKTSRKTENLLFKPVWGRVGEEIAFPGLTPSKPYRRIRRAARHDPCAWIAQEPFAADPVGVADTPWTLCLGVYTVDGHAAGVYGRAAPQALIGAEATDVAVCLDSGEAKDEIG